MSIHPCSRRPIAVVLACATLLMALAIASPAHAQGTMGMLAGPMTTPEVDGYARRLNLSPQQRRALDAIHDQYKQDFRALREGEIATFLEKMRGIEGRMPKRKSVEEFLQQMDVLSHKIAAVDNRFFDQLQSTLTEQQLPMLQRARQARQRTRLNGTQMMWMGGERPVDVSAILLDVELNEAERQASDPIMAGYESKLTSEMEKMYDLTHKMILDMFDAMERLGVTEESFEDPAQAEKAGQAMQEVWKDLMKKSQEAAGDIAALNDRTQQSVTATLTPDTARNFRNRYYRQAYPEASFALFMHDYVFAPALKRDDLTPEQREAITTTRDDLQRRLDGILQEAVTSLSVYRRSMSPFDYDPQKAEEYQKKQQELSAKADEARVAANTALEAALGKELLDKIGRVKSVHEEPQDVEGGGGLGMAQVEAQALQAEAADEEQTSDLVWGIDQFLPPMISEADIAEYSQRLDLTDEQRSVVHDLYQRYSESFNELNQGELARLQQTVSTMWRYDEQTQTSRGPTADSINEAYHQRSTALEAIKKVDDSFFSEMELAALTPEQVKTMPRIRQSRERTVYNRGGYFWGGGSSESSIDVARLAMRRRGAMSTEEWAPVEAELQKYEDAVAPLFRERYAKSLEAQKVQELWQAEMARAQSEGENNQIALGMRYQEMMREPQKALGEASAAVSELNHKTLESLTAALPPEASDTLRREYNRRAFPNVYNDGGAMDKVLTRARAMPDLTEEQTRLLSDLAAEYHPAYTALCDQMVKATEGSERNNMFAMTDENDVQDWQKREETLAKLRFDRGELNARAGGRLQEILTEDQVKRLGGLPKVKQAGEFEW